MVELSPAQRSHIWACVKRDDCHQLMLALKLYGVHSLQTLRQLDASLWHDGKVELGLMDVCAYTDVNVPEHGAEKCLKLLLDKYGTMGFSASVQHVISQCTQMNRTNLVKLLSS